MQKRLAYLDRLKIFMTVLVILHHTAITYGGAGSWFYYEHHDNVAANALLSIFTIVNQSFFMGLFFFISGYVTPASLERKGPGRFMKDRLIRFGIPIVFYMMLIDPLLGYISTGYRGSLAAYLKENVTSNPFQSFSEFAVGPLWYLFALLLFSAGYVVFSLIVAGRNSKTMLMLTPRLIAGYLVITAAATFLVRMVYPVGTEFMHLQLAYFPAYIGLFMAGIAAYRGNWLDYLSETASRKWRGTVILLIILLPVVMVLGGALEGDTSAFEGGLTWQAAFYAVIDPVLGFGISYTLLVSFRKRWNSAPAKRTGWLSANAFLVYIIHALLVTYISYGLRDLSIHPILKFMLVGCLALPLCFTLASVIRRIPGVKRVV
jgi:glucans biosynthesis protein C